MNLFEQACSWHDSANKLLENEFYQQSIYHYCLAGELYLKSVLHLVPHNTELEISHDIIGIYSAISSKYGKETKVTDAVKFLRKYFNESRYPTSDVIFTLQLSDDFANYAKCIRDYIENKCHISVNDLMNYFNSHK